MQVEIEAQLPSRGFTLIQHMLAFGWVFFFQNKGERSLWKNLHTDKSVVVEACVHLHSVSKAYLVQNPENGGKIFSQIMFLSFQSINGKGTHGHPVIALRGRNQEWFFHRSWDTPERAFSPKQMWKTGMQWCC